MKGLLRHALQGLALAGTGLALVATTCRPACERALPPEMMTFDVVDSGCGPTGEITVYVAQTCEVYVAGADPLALPTRGEFVPNESLADGGWELRDYTDVVQRECDVLRDEGGQPGDLVARCQWYPVDTITVPGTPCAAVLRPKDAP